MATIKGLRRFEETCRKTGGTGDNWHMTWAKNDSQFVTLCDGKGWPEIVGITGEDYNTRVVELKGDPIEPEFYHLPGFPELINVQGTMDLHRYYGFGIIAIDDCVYNFLSTPNHPFVQGDGPWTGARFIGAKLVYSPDLGATWHNQDGTPLTWEPWDERNTGNMAFWEPDQAFSLLTVLQMGRNYEHNRDGYVYIYAPNGNERDTMNQLVLCRVRKESILDRSAYEFFVSRDADGGNAKWSSNIKERGVVHTFPEGWVNIHYHPYAWHPSVVYNAGLGKYMMANWGMGTGPDDGMWFHKPSYLGFWIADQPWGPWTQIHDEEAWMPAGDANARAYQPQISPKWIAEDGRSFWLVWTDFQQVTPGYCFNWQKVELVMEE